MNPLLLPEIVENIFLFLDGKSIFNCGSVCRLWKDIVDNIPHNSLVWQNCCRNIPKDVFEEFSRKMYPKHCLWGKNVDYRQLYESWVSLSTLVSPETTPQTLDIEDHSDTVRCVAVSGHVLYCGHSTGEITVLCLCGTFMCANTHHQNYGEVLKMEPVSPPVSSECTSANHEYLVSMYSSGYIVLFQFDGSGTLVEVDKVRWLESPIDICVYRDSLCVVSVHSCEMCKLNFSGGRVRIVRNEIPKANFSRSNPLATYSIWGGLVSGISSLLRFYKDEEKNFVFSTVKKGHENLAHMQPILQMYFWRPMVAVWLTAKHAMYCSVGLDKVKEYSPCEVMVAFSGHPVSICLCGMVFIVGTNTGGLYTYDLNSYEDLLSLDLEKYSWMWPVGHDAISSISVTCNVNGPVVVTVLESKLCVLSCHFKSPNAFICEHAVSGMLCSSVNGEYFSYGFDKHVAMPEVIVFDLDNTLWPFKVNKDFLSPFVRHDEDVVDRKGRTVCCFPKVKEIVHRLHREGFSIAVASRTKSITGAYQLLHLFELNSYIPYKEVYPLRKLIHFHYIRAKSGVPFENMLFFDNDKRNLWDATSLHITAVQVPPTGMTEQLLRDGLRNFAHTRNCRVRDAENFEC